MITHEFEVISYLDALKGSESLMDQIHKRQPTLWVDRLPTVVALPTDRHVEEFTNLINDDVNTPYTATSLCFNMSNEERAMNLHEFTNLESTIIVVNVKVIAYGMSFRGIGNAMMIWPIGNVKTYRPELHAQLSARFREGDCRMVIISNDPGLEKRARKAMATLFGALYVQEEV